MTLRFRSVQHDQPLSAALGPESECNRAGTANWGRARRTNRNGANRLVAGRFRTDGGSVTVEAALVLPALVLVLVLCLAGIGCVTEQLRCVDAAREAARLAGRGDTAAAMAAAAEIAPSGASISIEQAGELVRVTVSAAPFGGLLPGVRVSATSVAASESAGGRSP